MEQEKRKYEVRFMVSLRPELAQLLDKLANNMLLHRSSLIRLLLSSFLERKKEVIELLRLYPDVGLHRKRLYMLVFSLPRDAKTKIEEIAREAGCSEASVVRRLISAVVTEDMDIVIKDFLADVFLKPAIKEVMKSEFRGEGEETGGELQKKE